MTTKFSEMDWCFYKFHLYKLDFYGCDKHHDQKKHGDKRVYLATRLEFTIAGSQGRNSSSNMEARTEEEVVEEGCLLSMMALYNSGPPAPGWYFS